MTLVIADEGPFVTVDQINLKNRIEKIPAMVYRVGLVGETPVLLKDRQKYDLPKRIYGKHELYKKIIMRTFNETAGALGVLLDGLKGTGKSLLLEAICNQQIDEGRPILAVSDSVSPALLKDFIVAMGPCVVTFDEFGKYYKEEAREKMLTLFSDSSLKKVMFIVTSNHTGELSDYMIHRPGRFLFKINYKGLMEEEILELLEGSNIEPSVQAYLLDYCKHHQCSFDVVRVLISCAFNVKTVDKFIEAISIHNVPNQIYTSYSLKEITYNGEKFEGDVAVKEKDAILSVTLTDKVTTKVLEEGSINWLTSPKVKLNDDGDDVRIKLSESLTVRIARHIRSYKGQGSTVDMGIYDKEYSSRVARRKERSNDLIDSNMSFGGDQNYQ